MFGHFWGCALGSATLQHRTESEQDGSPSQDKEFPSIRDDGGPLSRVRQEVLRIVHGMAFDIFVCVMLLANAILIGVQAI